MRAAFIINPVAGRGKGIRVWKKIEPWLDNNLNGYDHYFTRSSGDGRCLTELAQKEGATHLIAVGGDGTVHEIINSMDFYKGTLGLIPAGTGNDLSKTLKIPTDPFQAARGIKDWEPQKIDLGLVNGEYFINVLGIGFDAEVARVTNTDFKYLSGIIAYLAALLKVLCRYKNTVISVEYDDKVWEERSLLIAVGNGRYYGDGFCIVPQAVVNDGTLHICFIGDVPKKDIIFTLLKTLKGNHVYHPQIMVDKAQKITVSSPLPLNVHADGEVIGQLPLAIAVKKRILNILAPSDSFPQTCS